MRNGAIGVQWRLRVIMEWFVRSYWEKISKFNK